MRRLRTYAAVLWAFSSLVVLAPIAFLAFPFRRALHDLFSIWWARGVLAITGLRVVVEGAEAVPRGERFLVVSNHQSVADIPAIVVALQPHVSIRFVAKLANFRLPILGLAMRMFGHIGVDPRSARRSVEGLHDAATALRERCSLVVFPEGTRTRDGSVGDFKPSFFRVAQRAGVRLLPVSVSGAYEAMPHGTSAVRGGATVVVRVHPPLDAPGDERDAVQRAAADSREVIARAVGEGGRAGSSARVGAEPGAR
jgi:1-acyl-sn-glycerol-3-phosphate acyltransferase